MLCTIHPIRVQIVFTVLCTDFLLLAIHPEAGKFAVAPRATLLDNGVLRCGAMNKQLRRLKTC